MSCDRRIPQCRGTGDSGVVLVLVAACLGTILVMVALVLDLGGARQDRDLDQTGADSTALVAASGLSGTGQAAQASCTAAWDHLVANLPSLAGTEPPPCAALATACIPTEAREVEAAGGAYRVTFTHPVPDGHHLLAGRAGEPLDGTSCQRFGIRVEQDRRNLFQDGAVALDVGAVGRLVPGVGSVAAPLVLLEPTACEVLSLQGSGSLLVETASGAPGHIIVDSDGSGCSGNKVVYRHVGSASVTADAIALWAISAGNASGAYSPGAVSPVPTGSPSQVGRGAMDLRYRCDPAAGCSGPGPSHIDDLVAAWGSGVPEPYLAPHLGPFTRWTSSYGAASCSGSSGHTLVPAGNWYVDCPGGLTTNGRITFQGGNIVSDGRISAQGGLRVNCHVSADGSCSADPPHPSVWHLRSGDLVRGSDLELRETFVHLGGGTVDLTGSAELVWTAPDDPTFPFDDLLVWTESTQSIELHGNTSMVLEGIFFAPRASLRLRGTSGAAGLGTQVIVGSLDLGGTGHIHLAPREDRMLTLGGGKPVLIR